jgi:hypothetical protein
MKSFEELWAEFNKPRAKPIYSAATAVISDDTGLPAAVGRLYAMVNPAWPALVKIGSSGDLVKRLGWYQTGAPYRDYEMIAFSGVFQDVKQAERELHETFAAYRVDPSREWFRITRQQAIAAVGAAVAPKYDDPFEGMALGTNPEDWDD